jgi:hypothetical protein
MVENEESTVVSAVEREDNEQQEKAMRQYGKGYRGDVTGDGPAFEAQSSQGRPKPAERRVNELQTRAMLQHGKRFRGDITGDGPGPVVRSSPRKARPSAKVRETNEMAAQQASEAQSKGRRDDVWFLEGVLGHRTRNKELEYLLKWVGYELDLEKDWYPAVNANGSEALVHQYWLTRPGSLPTQVRSGFGWPKDWRQYQPLMESEDDEEGEQVRDADDTGSPSPAMEDVIEQKDDNESAADGEAARGVRASTSPGGLGASNRASPRGSTVPKSRGGKRKGTLSSARATGSDTTQQREEKEDPPADVASVIRALLSPAVGEESDSEAQNAPRMRTALLNNIADQQAAQGRKSLLKSADKAAGYQKQVEAARGRIGPRTDRFAHLFEDLTSLPQTETEIHDVLCEKLAQAHLNALPVKRLPVWKQWHPDTKESWNQGLQDGVAEIEVLLQKWDNSRDGLSLLKAVLIYISLPGQVLAKGSKLHRPDSTYEVTVEKTKGRGVWHFKTSTGKGAATTPELDPEADRSANLRSGGTARGSKDERKFGNVARLIRQGKSNAAKNAMNSRTGRPRGRPRLLT